MDEVQTGARAPDQPGPVRQTAGQPRSLSERPPVGARLPTEAAGQAAQNVAQTAKEQTRQVTGEVATQARSVAADVRDSVTNQAHAQNDRLAEGIRRLADELDEMAYDRKDSPARTVVSRVAQSSRQLADYLAERGPEGVLEEVQDFARRRPGTFLVSAAVAGFVVGRVGKGVLSATSTASGPTQTAPLRSEYPPPPASQVPAATDYPQTSQPAGYPQPGYPGGGTVVGSTEYAATGTGMPQPVSEPPPAPSPWEPPPTPPSGVNR